MIGVIKDVISVFTAKPDPKRFAVDSAPPNWFGELSIAPPAKRRNLSDRVRLENPETMTFVFPDLNPYDGLEIPQEITDKDRLALKAYRLNPDNPVYHNAKRYFAANPACSKTDLANSSASFGIAPMSAETAKDVLAAFRKAI